MSLTINDDCTSCDACVEVCPNQAITSASQVYLIDPAKCTECVGAHDDPQCVTVCPADCILPHPEFEESPEQLMAKYNRMHG